MNARAIKWSIAVYAIGRVALSLWALLIIQLNPLTVTNLNLYGTPVVTVFDERTSARGVFSPILDGRMLHFHAAPPYFTDSETGSLWDISGRAVSGELAGRSLSASAYTAEDIFPYRGTIGSSNPLLAPWQRFDTNWYIKIAQRSYSIDDGSTVYFPFYPLLIQFFGKLFPDHDLAAAFLTSNVALVGVFYLLYVIAEELVGSAAAGRTLVFLAIFPTAFFLFASYTESVFLLFSLASLRMGTKNRWVLAGLFGALAALTRLQGFALILPLAYLWWKNRWASLSEDQDAAKRVGERPAGERAVVEIGRYVQLSGLALLLVPLATGAFLLWQDLTLRAAPILAAYEAQLYARFVMPWDNILSAVSLIVNRQASFVDILNLIATVLFGGILVLLWTNREIPREWVLYAACMFIIPLFRMTTTQPLVSMLRYVIVLFPGFVLLGRWGANAWAQRTVVYVSIPLALYLSAQFVLWGWVG